MTILVTGSSGFVASHMVKYLQNLGHEVIKFDIKDGWSDITNFSKIHATFLEFKPIEVYHFAAQAFVKAGEENPERDLNINGIGTLNILRCAKEFGVKMVLTSSSAAEAPTSNYGISKRAAELYTIKWAKMEGLDAKVVRFSSVYGVGRGLAGPVNAFIEQARTGKPITIYGDGMLSRDFTYVYDAVYGTELVMSKGAPGEIYNIGTGKHSTVNEIALLVQKLSKSPIVYERDKISKFDTEERFFDTSPLKHLGYIPAYPLASGVVKTWEDLNTRNI